MQFLTLLNGLMQLVTRVDYIDFAGGIFRSRVTVIIPTANQDIVFPDKSGTPVVAEFPAAFSPSFLLQGTTSFPTYTVTGPTAFTLGSGVRSAGAETTYRLIANGANIPTFVGFSQKNGSLSYDNRSGNLNLITFRWDGTTAWYTIERSITATPNWVGAALQSGFTNFGGIYPTMKYLDSEGQVHLQGLIQKAWPIASETIIFQLPAELAPTSRVTIPVVDVVSLTHYRIDVMTNGNVVIIPFSTAPSTGFCYPSFSCAFWIR